MLSQKLKIYFWWNFGRFVVEISAELLEIFRASFRLIFTFFKGEFVGSREKGWRIWDRIPELPGGLSFNLSYEIER